MCRGDTLTFIGKTTTTANKKTTMSLAVFGPRGNGQLGRNFINKREILSRSLLITQVVLLPHVVLDY